MKPTQFKLNWKRQPVDERDLISQRFKQIKGPLPSSGELPVKIPIYDQMNAGSCTSNGGNAAFRFEWYQLKGDFKFDPSRLFTYYNTRLLEGTPNEDSGAYVRDVFKAMNKWGVCKDDIWPYSNYEKTLLTKPPQDCYNQALNQLVVKYASVPKDLTAIKQTILSGAGIIFGFDVYSSFFGNWTSIMPIPKKGESLEGGHCVLICAFDDSKQAVKIQNSWGEWKDQGYFWMPYSYLTSSHCDDFWCIEEIKLVEPLPPSPSPSPSNLDLVKSIFTKRSDFINLRETVVLNIGGLLGLDTNAKLSKSVNLQKIFNKLGY